MRFYHWPFLLALLLIPLLHRWWRNRNRPAKVSFSLPIPKRAASANPLRYFFLLKYLALAFLIAALARPQSSTRQIDRQVSGIDIMMVMDVSASMQIEDLGEHSRLDIAKQTMERFIRGRQNDRIGFIVFSGEPFTMAPPTLDYDLVLRGVRDADTGVLKDGTAIGDGLSLAVGRLRMSNAKTKIVVLLTDGDNNVGRIDPATAGELAAGYGIRVYTIAIGTEGPVKLPIRQKNYLGQTVTSYQTFENALNPELLQLIAKTTGGKFYRVTQGDALDSVFNEINQLEKSEVTTTEKINYEETYPFPLKIGVVLALLERLVAAGWWRIAL